MSAGIPTLVECAGCGRIVPGGHVEITPSGLPLCSLCGQTFLENVQSPVYGPAWGDDDPWYDPGEDSGDGWD